MSACIEYVKLESTREYSTREYSASVESDVQSICQFGEVVHKKKNGIFVITYATNTLRANLSSSDWTRNYL